MEFKIGKLYHLCDSYVAVFMFKNEFRIGGEKKRINSENLLLFVGTQKKENLGIIFYFFLDRNGEKVCLEQILAEHYFKETDEIETR